MAVNVKMVENVAAVATVKIIKSHLKNEQQHEPLAHSFAVQILQH